MILADHSVTQLLETSFTLASDSSCFPPNSPEAMCAALERGAVLYFEQSPLMPTQTDLCILREQARQGGLRHKNIALKPGKNNARKLTGVDRNQSDAAALQRAMLNYRNQAITWLQSILVPYRSQYEAEYTSYRPLEEAGRKVRLRARNDLLHVDSFPSRSLNGKRILRVFTNIHPEKQRVWKTGPTLDALIPIVSSRFKPPKLPQKPPWHPYGLPKFLQPRTAYDRWMLQCHHYLKESPGFQKEIPSRSWIFPPGSGWMVYTDVVSHAVISGQAALEQTFLVDLEAMVTPQHAPWQMLREYYGELNDRNQLPKR